MKRYDNAVDRFLQNKKDIPLAHIKKQNVRTWVDSLRTQVSQKTRTDFLSTLGLIFEHALERGHIQDDLVNPFRGIKHSDKKKKRSFIPWTDDELRKILNNHRLSNCDRIVSLIGRYSGMRQSEIFNCTLVTKDGVPCLSIAPTETYAGGKTPAAQRLVPIRASILDAVRRTFGQWGSQSSFSKRFSAAKTELVGPGYPDRAFHSLRPQFITLAANAGYSTEQIAWLVGHDGDKGLAMTGGLYMKGYSIELLRDLVEAVPELEGVTTS